MSNKQDDQVVIIRITHKPINGEIKLTEERLTISRDEWENDWRWQDERAIGIAREASEDESI